MKTLNEFLVENITKHYFVSDSSGNNVHRTTDVNQAISHAVEHSKNNPNITVRINYRTDKQLQHKLYHEYKNGVKTFDKSVGDSDFTGFRKGKK